MRAANKKLQSVIRGIARIEAQPRADPYASNVFRKAVLGGAPSGIPNVFEPLPIRSTISLDQYRLGIRPEHEANATETHQDDSFVFGSAATEATTASETVKDTTPSRAVPIDDLNIETEGLYEGLSKSDTELCLRGGPISLSSLPTRAGLTYGDRSITVLSSLELAPLQLNLLDFDSDHSSTELNCGLDTEDELLRSDSEEHEEPAKRDSPRPTIDITEPIVKSVVIKIDRSRIHWPVEKKADSQPSDTSSAADTEAKAEGLYLPGTNLWHRFQRYEFDDYQADEVTPSTVSDGNTYNRKRRASPPRHLPLIENRQPDTDLCDTDTDESCPTPIHPGLEPYLGQLAGACAVDKKLNRSMAKKALDAIIAHRSPAPVFDDQVVPRNAPRVSRLRPNLRHRLGARQ